jgi:hypothetical protein
VHACGGTHEEIDNNFQEAMKDSHFFFTEGYTFDPYNQAAWPFDATHHHQTAYNILGYFNTLVLYSKKEN